MLPILYIVIGLTCLVVGGEFLVRSSVGLSFKLKLSKMVIGLTVVSFATSMPELLVSLQAALDGFSDISLGNVIGSNIANIALVLGVTAMISPIIIDKDFYKFNWPVMMLFSLALYYMLWNDAKIDILEGVVLALAITLYVTLLVLRAKRNKKAVDVEEVDDKLKSVPYFKIITWLLIGGAGLYFGSGFLVEGAVNLAKKVGVSDRVISVTMIAIGTSVPELAASVIAAIKKEKAISLGNLIGSNIFNIGSVLGITAIIKPIQMQSAEVLSKDMWWLLGIAFVLFPLVFIPKKYEISRYKGFLLFLGYAVFVLMVFM
ncbi:calcium/sodium antiporter [Mesonia sp. K7]|uniref:calcium/sodium antiporter n=1 Tax=Mesonia sp. K7 TaxID=2218606 RepID=UPI000DA8E10B|nr:calcium/sodium antiporter [Mesonia sp. K7]PZD79647.1 sodium:calcium antiporter [Mesonia sp. K7]